LRRAFYNSNWQKFSAFLASAHLARDGLQLRWELGYEPPLLVN